MKILMGILKGKNVYNHDRNYDGNKDDKYN